jgi:hypothetical protein
VPHDACRVYKPLGTPEFELRITWSPEGGAPTGASAQKFTVLKTGERAAAAADMAYVFFACRGARFSGSRFVHIVIGVRRWGMPKEPEGDIKALKDAYATVAHLLAGHGQGTALREERRAPRAARAGPRVAADIRGNDRDQWALPARWRRTVAGRLADRRPGPVLAVGGPLLFAG